MRSNLVDVECEIALESNMAIAVTDGTMENERLKLFWLPKSQIEINDDGTVTMPEWLAIEKELI